METAAYVVEDDYYLQRQPHLTIEPDVGFAYFDDDGRLTHPLQEHRHLPAPRHDLPRPRASSRRSCASSRTPPGGTFGYKFSPTMEALLGVACHGHRQARSS